MGTNNSAAQWLIISLLLIYFQISLDLGNSDKFGTLLRTVLQVLSQLLEVAGLVEVGRHAEELLHYLRSTVTLESAASILCVQQVIYTGH